MQNRSLVRLTLSIGVYACLCTASTSERSVETTVQTRNQNDKLAVASARMSVQSSASQKEALKV